MFRSRGVYGDGGSLKRSLVGASIYRREPRGETYIDKVLGYSPLVYFPMNETAGLTADNLGSLGAAADGTYTGVTLNNAVGPDGVNGAPLFDGVNDLLDIDTVALVGGFNGATGTAAIWFKVRNVGVWTDGAQRMAIYLVADANNVYRIQRPAANSIMQGIMVAGAGVVAVNKTPVSDTGWVHAAITWSDGANADQAIFYYNGVAVAAASANLNVWAGALTTAFIGIETAAPTKPWSGWLAHAAIWTSVLTPAQILDLATV